MKKFFCALIALLLLLSVAACSAAGKTQETVPTAEEAAVLAEEPVQTAEATAPEQSAETAETQAPALEYARGTWTDHAYTNSYANVALTIPGDDSWVVATDEELANMMDVGADTLTNANEFTKALTKIKTVQEMMVQNPTNGSNIILQFENLSLTPGASAFDADTFAQALAENLNTMQDTFTYTIGDPFTAEVCGETYTVLPATVDEYGMIQYYFLRRVDHFMVELIVTAIGEDNMVATMELFEQP